MYDTALHPTFPTHASTHSWKVVDRCSAPTKFEPEYVVEHWTTKVLPELSYLYPLASGQEGMTTADVETIGLLKTEELRIRRERLDSTNDCAIMNE